MIQGRVPSLTDPLFRGPGDGPGWGPMSSRLLRLSTVGCSRSHVTGGPQAAKDTVGILFFSYHPQLRHDTCHQTQGVGRGVTVAEMKKKRDQNHRTDTRFKSKASRGHNFASICGT